MDENTVWVLNRLGVKLVGEDNVKALLDSAKMETACCGYVVKAGDTGPVHANPFNGAIQCHHCGQVYGVARTPAENAVIKNTADLVAELIDDSTARLPGRTAILLWQYETQLRAMVEPV